MSVRRDAAAIAELARDLVVQGLDRGQPTGEILALLREVGIPSAKAEEFLESIRASWERRQRAESLRWSGRVQLWLGAVGLGLGAALLVMARKAAIRAEPGGAAPMPDLLRWYLLPGVIAAVSAALLVRGWLRYRGSASVR